ncbi:MAG: hypothetical protein ASARMPRED_004349 [Alectoria sarmentosa]|nr:MAG: hypothetical protein ASARMPRED_004349 [Alectoria sarmentosa]
MSAPSSKGAKKKAGRTAVNALTQIEESKCLIALRDFTKLAEEKEVANIFEALGLEEPEDAVDSPKPSVSVSTRPKAKNMATSKLIYDMESLHDEVLFSPVLFFQDLEEIREFIGKT